MHDSSYFVLRYLLCSEKRVFVEERSDDLLACWSVYIMTIDEWRVLPERMTNGLPVIKPVVEYPFKLRESEIN